MSKDQTSEPLSLSIVIPVLNEAETISACLKNLQGLRARGVEVIVVDGGSEDDTVVLATGLADRVIHGERGRARQMNVGAAEARGEWLLFLHADTRLPEAMDDIMLAWRFSKAQWGFFSIRFIDGPGVLAVVAWAMNRRAYLSGIGTGDQCQFVQRELFEAIGGFADIPLMEDIELSKRLKRHGRPLVVTRKAETSGRKWARHGVLRTIGLMWRLRLAYFFGASPEKLARRYYPEHDR